MTDLFLITDEAGTLLFRSRAVTLHHSAQAALVAAAKEHARGLVPIAGRNTYVKEVSLQGKRHLFFLDFDRLCTRFGVAADRAAEGLFDIARFAAEPKKDILLGTLLRLVSECYATELREDRVRISLHAPACDLPVRVAPGAFSLCFALLLRLAAGENGLVQVGFARECGRVTLFADGEGESPLPMGERDLLTILLYEASAAAGFAAEIREATGGLSLSITLDPLDVSLLGCKVEQLARYRGTISYYLSLFL